MTPALLEGCRSKITYYECPGCGCEVVGCAAPFLLQPYTMLVGLDFLGRRENFFAHK